MVGFLVVFVVIMVFGYLSSKADPVKAAQIEKEVIARAKNGSFAENLAGPWIKTDYANKFVDYKISIDKLKLGEFWERFGAGDAKFGTEYAMPFYGTVVRYYLDHSKIMIFNLISNSWDEIKISDNKIHFQTEPSSYNETYIGTWKSFYINTKMNKFLIEDMNTRVKGGDCKVEWEMRCLITEITDTDTYLETQKFLWKRGYGDDELKVNHRLKVESTKTDGDELEYIFDIDSDKHTDTASFIATYEKEDDFFYVKYAWGKIGNGGYDTAIMERLNDDPKFEEDCLEAINRYNSRLEEDKKNKTINNINDWILDMEAKRLYARKVVKWEVEDGVYNLILSDGAECEIPSDIIDSVLDSAFKGEDADEQVSLTHHGDNKNFNLPYKFIWEIEQNRLKIKTKH